jgi:hypothetical protein
MATSPATIFESSTSSSAPKAKHNTGKNLKENSRREISSRAWL